MLVLSLTATLLVATQLEGAHEDLASQALGILEARCSSCHNPESDKRKAVRAWADALDVAGSIEEGLLVPGDALGSDIWLAIDEGSMPPEDASESPVSQEELDVLAAWIAAGAPATTGEVKPEVVDPQDEPLTGVTAPTEQSAALTDPNPTLAETDGGSPLGLLHPTVVHFPVALLLTAALAELLALLGAKRLRGSARFCLWLGVIGAFVSSWLGWALADYDPRVGTAVAPVERHRWYAVACLATAFLALIAFELRQRRAAGPWSKRLAPLLLFLAAALVGFTGHLGGGLSFGSEWLNPALPESLRALLQELDALLP